MKSRLSLSGLIRVALLVAWLPGITHAGPAFEILETEAVRELVGDISSEPSPDYPARLLYTNSMWKLPTESSVEYREEVLLEIISDNAKHEYGDLKLPFDARFTSITVESAETWLPDGSILPIMEGADNELVPPEFSQAAMYGDLKTRIISFSGVEPGAVLHWRITIRTDYPPGSRMIWDTMMLKREIPVKTMIFTVTFPGETPVRYMLRNGADDPEVSREETWTVWKWTCSDIEPVRQEWMMPDVSNLIPSVMVTGCRDMEMLNDWFQKVFYPESHDKTVENTKPDVEERVPGPGEMTGVIDTIFRRVVDQVKTIDLPAGFRGYRPADPESVLARGYGDILDKARLLESLLNNAGIQTDIVFVSDSRDRRTGEFASLDGFDTVAVIAQPGTGREVWLNPVDRHARPGWISYGAGVEGIRFTGDHAIAVAIPEPSIYQSMSRQSVSLVLSGDGSFSGRVDWQGTGWYEHNLRSRFRDLSGPQQLIELERDMFDADMPIVVTRWNRPDWNDFAGILNLGVEFDCPIEGLQSKELMVVPVTVLPMEDIRISLPVLEPGREYPVELDAPGVEITHITIDVPPAYSIEYYPHNLIEENKVVKIIQNVNIVESGIEISRMIQWKETFIERSLLETVTAGCEIISQPSENLLILKLNQED